MTGHNHKRHPAPRHRTLPRPATNDSATDFQILSKQMTVAGRNYATQLKIQLVRLG